MQQEIKTLSTDDIFSIAEKTGYGIGYVYKLISENPFITDINYDFEANPQRTIEYDDSFSIPKPPQLTTTDPGFDSSLFFTAINNQTIFDVVAQSYGDMGNLYKLLKDNNISNVNDTAITGKMFTFNGNNISDVGFFNSLIKRKLIISTGDFKTTDANTFYRISIAGNRRISGPGNYRIYK